jgi:hypothetical protein
MAEVKIIKYGTNQQISGLVSADDSARFATLGIGMAAPSTGLGIAGDIAFQAISPSALAAGNNNNYSGSDGRSFARVSGDAGGTSTITGFSAGSDGRMLIVVNISSNNVTITHQDINSMAGNRVITATALSLVLTVDDAVCLIYDAITLRWRQITGLV